MKATTPMTDATPRTPRLRLDGLSKTYGPTRVLTDVGLSLAPGEVQGLIGQNGSGKSTLVKILSGLVRPDPGGRVSVDGEAIALPSRPSDLDRHGMSFVHQDLGLIPGSSVVENVRMGRFRRHPVTRRIRWATEEELTRGTLARLRCDVDPRQDVRELRPGQRALVAIARALQSHETGHGCIVFDESTQSLPRESLGEFYDVVAQLAAEGTSVLLVSHRLDEVLRLADRVTVLQDGHVTAESVPTGGLTESSLARLLLGREIELETLSRAPSRPEQTSPALRVSGLRGGPFRGLDVEVRAGEVVGVTGPTGAGHELLPDVLGGAVGGMTGRLDLPDGTAMDLGRADAAGHIAAGIALVPEGRTTEGLALAMTALENLTLPRIRTGNRGYLRRGWQRGEFATAADLLGIVPRDPDLIVGQFSGGNQQKILLAKWLLNHPGVLVLHEPTQAVDVGARVDILRAVRAAADAGAAVLISSVEAQDLAYVCDRVIVLREGREHARFERTPSHDLSAHEILDAL